MKDLRTPVEGPRLLGLVSEQDFGPICTAPPIPGLQGLVGKVPPTLRIGPARSALRTIAWLWRPRPLCSNTPTLGLDSEGTASGLNLRSPAHCALRLRPPR